MWSKVRDDLPLYALVMLLTGVFALVAGELFPAGVGIILTVAFTLTLLLIGRMD
jgi:hypothetical protein